MKRPVWSLGLATALLVLAGCAGRSTPSNPDGALEPAAPRERGKLAVKDERLLQGAPCGVEGPGCPEGTTCAFLDLESGQRSLCVDVRAVCAGLACASGECLILESYPIQVRCSR